MPSLSLDLQNQTFFCLCFFFLSLSLKATQQQRKQKNTFLESITMTSFQSSKPQGICLFSFLFTHHIMSMSVCFFLSYIDLHLCVLTLDPFHNSCFCLAGVWIMYKPIWILFTMYKKYFGVINLYPIRLHGLIFMMIKVIIVKCQPQ